LQPGFNHNFAADATAAGTARVATAARRRYTSGMAPKEISLDELRDGIRASGLRVTASRIAVLRSLHRESAPRAHGEIAEELAPEGWDRATVYRILTDFVEAGLVRRADLGDHVWRFERIRVETQHETADHPHFLCNECGDVTCLPDESVRVAPARGAPKALRKKGLEIQIRGVCDRCA
jgi:Fur family ferric uptake transcriptional regulator